MLNTRANLNALGRNCLPFEHGPIAAERQSILDRLDCMPYHPTAGLQVRTPANTMYDARFMEKAVFSRNHVFHSPRKVFQILSSRSLPLFNDQRTRTAADIIERGIISIENVVSGGYISDVTSAFEHRDGFPVPNGGSSVLTSAISYVEHTTSHSIRPLTNSMFCPRGVDGDAPMEHLRRTQTNNTPPMDVDMGEPGEGWAEMEIYDDDIRMDGQEDLGLDNIMKRPGEDLVFTSTLCTWECFTESRGKPPFVLNHTSESKVDAFCVTSAYSQEYLTASSASILVDEEAAMAGSGDCATPVFTDYLLAMFATLGLGADVGLPMTGPACVGLPQRLIMSAD